MFTMLIPCNRYHKWLRNCFDSINKNLPDLPCEILLVLNNTSIDSINEISSLRDELLPSARIINSGKGTLSDALNFGLMDASFEYIARLDSDDELCKGRLSAQIEFLEQNSNVSLVGTYSRVISEDGSLGKVVKFPEHSQDIIRALRYGNCIAHPTVTFRKSIAVKAGKFNNNFPHAEDYDLWIRMSEISGVANLPIIGVNYRQHPEQVSQTHLRDQMNSTRNLAVQAIGKSLEIEGMKVNSEELESMASLELMRQKSFRLRKEKAHLEIRQYIAFRNSLSGREKMVRLSLILMNIPRTLLFWLAKRIIRKVWETLWR